MAALQFCAGEALIEELSKEQKLVKLLGDIGEKVKSAGDAQRKVGEGNQSSGSCEVSAFESKVSDLYLRRQIPQRHLL